MTNQNPGYRDLVVWQRAMDLVVEVYRFKKALPRDEMFGLASQMRRAAVFRPQQYCRGQGTSFTKGIAPVSLSRERIVAGTANSDHGSGSTRLHKPRRGTCTSRARE